MSTQQDVDEPVWARADSFAGAPDGFGWMDPKGEFHSLKSFEDLLKVIGGDEAGRVMLVWAEGHSHLILPEELPGAEDAVHQARDRRIELRMSQGRTRLCVGGLLLAALTIHQVWQLWSAQASAEGLWVSVITLVRGLIASLPMGFGLLLWFVLSFVPWYEAVKDRREWKLDPSADTVALVPTLRLDTWMLLQKAPVTRMLAGCMLVVGVVQYFWGAHALSAAGLIKPAYHAGEYWRLLTAPWLHGNVVHFLFNGLALLYLGKRVELFARWPHLLLVLLFSIVAGGILSVRYLEAPSVGISGGLMGWLGFLLIFETLHRRLVTRSARRRLLAGVLLTGVMGVIGYRFIDNAAHLGGLLAGMVYAGIVFPSSMSIHRPKILRIDRVAGILAAVVLVAGLVQVLLRLVEVTR